MNLERYLQKLEKCPKSGQDCLNILTECCKEVEPYIKPLSYIFPEVVSVYGDIRHKTKSKQNHHLPESGIFKEWYKHMKECLIILLECREDFDKAKYSTNFEMDDIIAILERKTSLKQYAEAVNKRKKFIS
jgi:hypothetical protein